MGEYHEGPCSVCGDTDWRVGWRDTADNKLYYLCAQHRHLRVPPAGIRSDDIQDMRECTLYDALVAERIQRAAITAAVGPEVDELREALRKLVETSWEIPDRCKVTIAVRYDYWRDARAVLAKTGGGK